MAELLQVLLLAAAAVYFALIVALRRGLGVLKKGETDSRPTVSVIVAARDEADTIGICLSCLAEQDYPSHLVEVVVVDDRSSDDTCARAAEWEDRIPGLKVVAVASPRYRCPKKSAIDLGIRHSSGDLILTTDADCRPLPGWISSTVRCFAPDVGVVAGHAPLASPGGLLGSLLSLQATVVSAIAAGSAGTGHPLTCSGRNLAYRRSAFESVGGFETIGHIVGGDDVLLMRAIWRRTPLRVLYNPDRASWVASDVHQTGRFGRQVRYQSKAIHAGGSILILAFLIYIFHFALAVMPGMAWVRPGLWQPFLLLLGFKIVADGTFLWRALGLFGMRTRLAWLPVVEFIAVPYVVVFFALGALRSPRWK